MTHPHFADTDLFAQSKLLASLEQVFHALTNQGFIVLDDALPSALIKALRTVALARQQSFKVAGTGKNAAVSQLRGDKIAWLEPEDNAPEVQAYLAMLRDLQQALNRHLMMGLVDVETHFALYAPGQAYHTHIDQFSSRSRNVANTHTHGLFPNMKRALSVITYLNEDWQTQDGGALKLYLDEHSQCPPSSAKATIIPPQSGRMVLFLSDRFWHEVLPAQKPRLSITAWFRTSA